MNLGIVQTAVQSWMKKVRDKKMNYKSFNLGDWIGHISGAIEDERELDGNEMRDLVEF